MTDERAELKRKEKTFRVVQQYQNKKLGLSQTRAQLKDLGYAEWEIDLYIDGDVMGYEP